MVPVPVPAADDDTAGPVTESLDSWLASLLPDGGLGAQGDAVFRHLLADPGHASHAPASAISEATGASISSVTRTAQRLGFSGWPRLQAELRTRYLARLSMIDVAATHGATSTPFSDALRRDLRSLDEAMRIIDEAQIRRVAERIAAAENVYVTAQGSYAAVGLALVHNIGLAGYPVRELLSQPATLSNSTARMTSRDLLIVCSYWRIYDIAVIAAQQASRRGAGVVVLADNLPQALRTVTDEAVIVAAEGTSFFPSLTVAMAVQQGIVATLATLDPDRTHASLKAAEQGWQDFKLLHHSVPRSDPNGRG